MIYGERELRKHGIKTSDVCIIGAGPAGISLALRLNGTSLRVVVLESGGLDFDAENQRLNQGHNIGHDYFPLNASRLRYLGGTSGHWNGKCGMLFSEDMEAKEGVPYTGWPIGPDDLQPYYSIAQELCQLGALEDYDENSSGHQQRVRDLPQRGDSKLIYQLYQMSPPTRFGSHYRRDLEGSKNVHVYLNVNARELVASETDNAIKQVSVRTLAGLDLVVRSRSFVLATGGIENARILLASNSSERGGIGNQNDLVGRFFMDHLIVSDVAVLATRAKGATPEAFGWTRDGDTPWFGGSPIAKTRIDLGVAHCEGLEHGTAKRGRAKVRFRLARTLEQSDDTSAELPVVLDALSKFQSARATTGGPLLGRRDLASALVSGSTREPGQAEPSLVMLKASVEQLPDRESRVSLHPEERDALGMPVVELHWKVGEREFEDLQQNLRWLASELLAARIGTLKINLGDYADFDSRVHGQWHQMGTTRMSQSPDNGVVDRNCRVHGRSNLFIAGSSVFPTCGESNPTLTICALATRLGDHLAGLYGGEVR